MLTPKQLIAARQNLVKARAAKIALQEAREAKKLTTAKRIDLDRAVSARVFPPRDI